MLNNKKINSTKSFKQIWEEDKLKKEVKGIKFEVKDSNLYIDNKLIEFNSYDIIEIIDAGANAIVLKAKEKISNRICAIKVWFSKDKFTGKLNIEKHKKEIEKISKFDSDLIVKYYSTDIVNNYAYCSMEYIEGQTLRSYLKSRHPDLSTRYRIMNDIVKALRVAHKKNIYHGDLHDRNILINNFGEVKILDFGTSLGKKEYSMSRDSKLMYKLGEQVMGDFEYSKLMWMNEYCPEELCPRTVRLIIESMSKVIVLLDYLRYGVTENTIKDLALFTTIVPFYNLRYILEEVLDYSDDDAKEVNSNLFLKELKNNIAKRLEIYNLINIESNDIKLLYTKINKCFVEKTANYLEEKYIYYDEHEVELFKANLYADYIKVDYNDTQLDIIDKALEKFN